MENEFFENDRMLYRKINGESKRVCTAFPIYMGCYNSGSDEQRKYIYRFKVYSKFRIEPFLVEIPGNKLTSKHTFSRALIKRVPFAKFEGSEVDYKAYTTEIFNQHT